MSDLDNSAAPAATPQAVEQRPGAGASPTTAPAPDDRSEWLAWRRQGIGASDVAGIIGQSPWATAWSVWADKAGLVADDRQTDAMRYGQLAETIVEQIWTERTGLEVERQQERCEHPDHPWMRCTIDGITGDPKVIDSALIEIKTTSDSAAAWGDEIPIYYRTQASWQSMVTGIPVVVFAVLHMAFGRLEFQTYRYEPDPDDQAWLAEQCSKFWHEHVLTGVAPEVDASKVTTDALSMAFPFSDESEMEADPTLAKFVEQYRRAKQATRDAQDHERNLANRIKSALGDHESLTVDGKRAISWKTQARRSIDTKALMSRHPDLAAEFTTETTHRVLRTHG